MTQITETDVIVGRTYSAKHPKPLIFGTDDKTVVWVSPDRKYIEFDHPNLEGGKKYPGMLMKSFLDWVGGIRVHHECIHCGYKGDALMCPWHKQRMVFRMSGCGNGQFKRAEKCVS